MLKREEPISCNNKDAWNALSKFQKEAVAMAVNVTSLQGTAKANHLNGLGMAEMHDKNIIPEEFPAEVLVIIGLG